MKGSTTYLPNAEGRASPVVTIAAASVAPHVSLLLAYHIAESASNKIEVIIVPPALPLIDAVPPTVARTKKNRKNAAAPAAPAAAFVDNSTATPTSSPAPAMKKGKTTGKKKST
jgi:hypothetical protein